MEAERTVVVFQAGGVRGAFPVEQVQEIVPMATLLAPPGMPALLHGFLNLRGTAVPILRFDRLFSTGECFPGLHTPLLIFRIPERPVGLLVDAVSDIVRTTDLSLLPVPADYSFNGSATAELGIASGPAYLFSVERILLEREHRLLSEFQAVAQRRLSDLGPTSEGSRAS